MAVGAVTFHWGVAKAASGIDPGRAEHLSRSSARVLTFAALGIALGLMGVGYRQADELRFPGDPIGTGLDLLLGTPWAVAWWWAAGGCSLVLAGAILARRGDRRADGGGHGWGWWVAGVGLLPLVVFPGLTGHANGADARYIALGLDAAHVIAAGTWVGTLGVLLLVGRRWIEQLVPAFSPIAMASVGTLVATGLVASWREIGSVPGYWDTGYGRILLLKLALVGAVALLGAINWRRLTPRLGSPEGDRAMTRAGSIEFLIGQVVLVVTAVLVRTSP